MGILNRLTIKHLKMNPKRTIVTIFGIILSMALMLGCGLLASSFIESMKEEAMKDHGTYHAVFEGIDPEEANVIANHLEVEKSYFYSSLGFAEFSDSQNDSKPYYFIAAASKEMLESQTLLDGRYPENENEVVITDHIRSNGGKTIEIGETLSLNIGGRMQEGNLTFENSRYLPGMEGIVPTLSKEYKVVGIIKRSYTEDYSAAGYTIFTLTNHYESNDNNYVYVEYKKPKNAYETTKEIAGNLDLANSQVNYNSSILYFYGTTAYGNVNRSILSILSFALTLLSIGCIIVIYNSFAISTMERKRQFGLYSSVGATRRQILHTVFFEAFVVGVIGITIGILGAFLGIYIVLEVLNYLLASVWNYHLHLVINWVFIVVPILFMIAVVFFSALIPALRASRVTPIEAIRENDEIKLPKRKLWTPKFITKLFGIEGELALKNMKRNKRKYRITVLSLFVSIVLFLTFSTYLTYGVATIHDYDYYDYDIGITFTDKYEEKVKEIRNDSRIDTSYLFQEASVSYEINYDWYVDEFATYMKNQNYELGNLSFIILDDQDFSKFADKYHVSMDTSFLLNVGNIVQYSGNDRFSYRGKLFQQDVDRFNVCLYDENAKDLVCDKQISNIQLIDEVPVGFQYTMMEFTQTIFISKSHYMQLFSDFEEQGTRYANLIILSKDYNSLYEDFEKKYDDYTTYFHSPKISQKEQKNAMLAIKILLYGFISLVTLIGVTSVFNTIHTSINLRRKEFAMLRSMGLTPNGFNKMILFESLFFGLKSLFYGLPISFLCMLFVHHSMGGITDRDELLIPWASVVLVIVAVFLIVLLSMHYSVQKIKKENILNAIRDENI